MKLQPKLQNALTSAGLHRSARKELVACPEECHLVGLRLVLRLNGCRSDPCSPWARPEAVDQFGKEIEMAATLTPSPVLPNC
jgi:hypothetical protein